LEKEAREALVSPRNRDGTSNPGGKDGVEAGREGIAVTKPLMKGLATTALGGSLHKSTTSDQALNLRVFDLSFDGSFRPNTEIEDLDEMQLTTHLKSLPSQCPRTVRIYICNSDSRPPDSALRSYLRDMGLENIGIPRLTDVSNISRLA
jgi:hypothetical protein